VVGAVLLASAGCSAARSRVGEAEAVRPSPAAPTGITWTDVAGVRTNGNSLTKTLPSNAWGDAGAASKECVAGDGAVQFTTAEANTYKMAGLTHAVTGSSYEDIDFGVFLESDGLVAVFEGGAYVGNFGAYAANDVFTVRVAGTHVTYLRNGKAFYASTKTPMLPLVFDASLYSEGATINGVSLTP
jgi:hypothetical protein